MGDLEIDDSGGDDVSGSWGGDRARTHGGGGGGDQVQRCVEKSDATPGSFAISADPTELAGMTTEASPVLPLATVKLDVPPTKRRVWPPELPSNAILPPGPATVMYPPAPSMSGSRRIVRVEPSSS